MGMWRGSKGGARGCGDRGSKGGYMPPKTIILIKKTEVTHCGNVTHCGHVTHGGNVITLRCPVGPAWESGLSHPLFPRNANSQEQLVLETTAAGDSVEEDVTLRLVTLFDRPGRLLHTAGGARTQRQRGAARAEAEGRAHAEAHAHDQHGVTTSAS